MKALPKFLFLLLMVFAAPVSAQKLMLAHVAVNPSQGMLHLAKDSGILAKYGFTADVLLIPGTPGVAQGLESGRIEVGVLGDSGLLLVFRGRAKPLKGGSAREMGFRGTDAPLTTTDRKIKADRGAVVRFMQAYLETIHFFQTNKAGTARILGKYMRGVSEEHITLWCDDLRAMVRQVPYADEEALRTELEMMNIPGGQIPPGYVNNSILDEIKKSGFIDKLYKQ